MKTYTLCLVLLITFSGCVIPSPATRSSESSSNNEVKASPTNNELSLDRAQTTLNSLADANSMGRLVIRGGVNENENSATVDFDDDGTGKWAGGTGTATFSRYNDGRWFLTGFRGRFKYKTGAFEHITWKPSLEVQ